MADNYPHWSNFPSDGYLHYWYYAGIGVWQTACLVDAMQINPPEMDPSGSDLPVCQKCLKQYKRRLGITEEA